MLTQGVGEQGEGLSGGVREGFANKVRRCELDVFQRR